MLSVEVLQDYSYVMWSAVLMVFHLFLVGQDVRLTRMPLFTKSWMVEHFGAENEKANNPEFMEMSFGYPDTGNGRFSDKLSYKDWFKFNNAQRVHLNYFEFMAITLVALFMAGIFQPLWAASIGIMGIFGRELYGIAYGRMNNPNGRLIGAMVHEAGVFVNIGIVFYNVVPLCLRALSG
jgi:hypothetical protein